MNLIIRAFTAMVVSAIVLGATPARAGEARDGSWGYGIELRASGPAPCSPATPAPCTGYVYSWRCLSPVEFRVKRVESYLEVAGPQYVGVELRARLVRRHQSAAGTPWTIDAEHFPGRATTTSRHLTAVDVGTPVETTPRWDLEVQFRFDRSAGRPDVVRTTRSPIAIDCS